MEFLLQRHQDSARNLIEEIRGHLLESEHDCCFQYCYKSGENGFLFQAYMLLGMAYQAQGGILNAMICYNSAQDMASTFSDCMDAEIHVLWCRHLQNDNAGIIDRLNTIYDADIHQSVKGTLLYILGCIHRVLTHFEKAEEILQNACQLFSDLGNKIKFDVCRSELGRVYRATGDFSKALQLQKEFYFSALRRGDIANLGLSCSLLGFTYQYYKPSNMSNPDLNLSVQYLAVGMQLSIEYGAKDNVGWCLNNIAKAYIKDKYFREALQLCKQRLAIAKETDNATGEGTAYGNAGLACRGLGEYNQAAEYHKSYLQMVGERYLDKAWMEHELALDNLLLGDYVTAVNYAIQELLTNSTIQSHYDLTCMSDKSKVANFEKNQARCFDLLQYLLVEMGNYEAALVYADFGRALSVSDLFTRKHNLASGSYSRLANHITTLDAAFVTQSIGNFHKIVDKLCAILVFYSLIDIPVEVESEKTTRLYTWVILPKTSNIQFIQQWVTKPDISLFNVLCGKENQYFQEVVHAFCMSSASQEDDKWLRDIVLCDNNSTFKDDCANHYPCNLKLDAVLEKLYNILIQPLEHHLDISTFKKIVFVPHKTLITVPFCALRNSYHSSLVNYFAVSISLSIYLLEQTVEAIGKHLDKESEKVLIVGNPSMPSTSLSPLPGGEQEAFYVAEILAKSKEVILLCGAAATKYEVTRHIEGSTIVHFATHAFLEDPFTVSSAAYSDYSTKGSIILAKSNGQCSGILTSVEVQNKTIPAELVVLSCCKTAQGKATNEGTLGLSRAFISAGASAVLVTLWSIPDLHTVELMRKFYTYYAISHDAASALQLAMLYMSTELHLDFGYWGAFSLIGITPGYLV